MSSMGTQTRGSLGLDALYQLKYDVISDMYRQAAHSEMEAAYRDFYEGGGSGNLKHPVLEYLLFYVFGSDLIGSLAFRLDPYWQVAKTGTAFFDKSREILFGNTPSTVVRTNRTRRWPIYQGNVTAYNFARDQIDQNHLVQQTNGWSVGPMSSTVTESRSLSHQKVLNNLGLKGFCLDTTWKSRNPNQNISKRKIRRNELNAQGEFELFDISSLGFEFQHGGQYLDQRTDNLQAVGNNLWLTYIQKITNGGGLQDSSARVNAGDVDSLLVQERSRASVLMQDNVDKLFARCVPSRRYTNLFYNAAELGEAAKMAKSTIQTWRELQALMGGKVAFIRYVTNPKLWTQKNIYPLVQQLRACDVIVDLDKSLADAYLNFKFGWQSTYSALVSTLKAPKLAAADLNRLIERNGKFSTLHTSMKFIEQAPSAIACYMPFYDHLTMDGPTVATATREVELRCSVNVGIRFPDAQIPSFKNVLFLEKMGAIPTPGDIFDLIPWTWLIDWWAGLGDYIHLMDAINGDDSLINWGELSYSANTEVRSTQTYAHTETIQRRSLPPDTVNTPWHEEIRVNKRVCTGRYQVVYKRRQSLDDLTSVKLYSGAGLSDYQSSILGALLTKFT